MDSPSDPLGPDPPPGPALDAVIERLEAIQRLCDRIDRRLDSPVAPGTPSDGEPSTKPGPLPRRRFTLLDGMILIASLAPGLMITVYLSEEIGFYASPADGPAEAIAWAGFGLAHAVPCLATLVLGLLILRYVLPRHRRQRPWRHPRDAPLIAQAVAVVVFGPIYAVVFSVSGPPVGIAACFLLPMSVAPAVLTARITPIPSELRGPPRDWIDVAAALVGLVWLVAAVPCFLAVFHTR